MHGHETNLFSLVLDSNLINFVVVAGAVIFALVKFLPNAAAEQKASLEVQLKEAREAREAAESKLDELTRKLSGSDHELKQIVAEAESMSANLHKQTVEEARTQIARMKDQAEKDIQAKKNSAVQSIKTLATQAAIALTEESVRQSSKDEKVLRTIQDKFLSDLEASLK